MLHNLREEVSEGEKSSGVACHQVFLYDHHSVDTLHQFLLQQQVAIDSIEVKAGRHRGYQLWGGGGGGGGGGGIKINGGGGTVRWGGGGGGGGTPLTLLGETTLLGQNLTLSLLTNAFIYHSSASISHSMWLFSHSYRTLRGFFLTLFILLSLLTSKLG